MGQHLVVVTLSFRNIKEKQKLLLTECDEVLLS